MLLLTVSLSDGRSQVHLDIDYSCDYAVGSVFDQATSAAVSAVSAVSSIVQSAEVDATGKTVSPNKSKKMRSSKFH